VLSGIALVEKIRAEASLAHLPVVVITSGGDREKEKLSGLGVTTFLRKPVSYHDVASAIRALLEPRGEGGVRAAAAPGGEGSARGLTDAAGVPMDPADAKPASRR
jgi:DNA-binding response OmpR family regulator